MVLLSIISVYLLSDACRQVFGGGLAVESAADWKLRRLLALVAFRCLCPLVPKGRPIALRTTARSSKDIHEAGLVPLCRRPRCHSCQCGLELGDGGHRKCLGILEKRTFWPFGADFAREMGRFPRRRRRFLDPALGSRCRRRCLRPPAWLARWRCPSISAFLSIFIDVVAISGSVLRWWRAF